MSLNRFIAMLLLVGVSAQPLAALDCGSMGPSQSPPAPSDDHASHAAHQTAESCNCDAVETDDRAPTPDMPSTCVFHSACSASAASLAVSLTEAPGPQHEGIVLVGQYLSNPDLSQDPPPPRPLR